MFFFSLLSLAAWSWLSLCGTISQALIFQVQQRTDNIVSASAENEKSSQGVKSAVYQMTFAPRHLYMTEPSHKRGMDKWKERVWGEGQEKLEVGATTEKRSSFSLLANGPFCRKRGPQPSGIAVCLVATKIIMKHPCIMFTGTTATSSSGIFLHKVNKSQY